MTIDTQARDADLIARSLTEPDLFTAVPDRHSGNILRYAYARLGPELAEDVTAETFLDAFRRRSTCDSAWSAWCDQLPADSERSRVMEDCQAQVAARWNATQDSQG